MREERLRKMREYLEQHEMCHLDTLCQLFGVSKITIRRDVETLCSLGVVSKIYGGVVLNKSKVPSVLPYQQRQEQNAEAKEYIGRLAASIIEPGDTIFVDSGTTTIRLLKYVREKQINILTTSLGVAAECQNYPLHNVIILGGELSRVSSSLVGDRTLNNLKAYNIGKAFLAATGASLETGFTNTLPNEAMVKKAAIARSAQTYVMMDSSKWDVVSLMTFAELTSVSGVITDKQPPEHFLEQFYNHSMATLYR